MGMVDSLYRTLPQCLYIVGIVSNTYNVEHHIVVD